MYLFLLCVCSYFASTYVCALHESSALRDQKRISDSLELEL